MARTQTFTVAVRIAGSDLPVRNAHANPGRIWVEGELHKEDCTFPNGKEIALYIDGALESVTLTGTKWTGPVSWLDGHWEFNMPAELGTYDVQAKFLGDGELGPSETPVIPIEVTQEEEMPLWELALIGIVVIGGAVIVANISPLIAMVIKE